VNAKRRNRLAAFLLVLAAGLVVLERCNRLPPLENRTVSQAIAVSEATRLARTVTTLLAPHPGVSGIHPLRDARDAFAARYRLAAAAERSLDVQYYIWRNDLSGTLLMKALVDAADRGVRVRLLLDDNSTSGLDEAIAAIDSHQRIEVRLFNPFAIRTPRVLGYITDFPRLNRRMHNKSFTADNQVTIIGGRNVGDEYFGATEGVLFADLDVLAIGPVVSEVSADFDRYWASESAYPADRLLRSVDAAKVAQIAAAAARVERDAAAVAYLKAVRESQFVRQLMDRTLPFEWAVARMISDSPAKALDRARREELLFEKFGAIFGEPATELDLVSPYFVPGSGGVDLFGGWAKRGVKVRVLTNSLEATDVALVHAGYVKQRKALLETGVALYELRKRGGNRPAVSAGMFGSSGSSLHAKTFAVDRSRIFIGSFNFDPRSTELNTEMGFVIDSPALAQRMAKVFDDDVPVNAWEVRLSQSGDAEWVERKAGTAARRHRTEPGTGWWQRLGVALLSFLPIDPLL
jgi:cardiolipin synthase C